ncbi:MAG: YraN family protein [Stanieria sp.]
MNKVGELGEKFVARWLETQGYQLYYHRWRCRWGEIDLILSEKTTKILVFVEVKTRSDKNWDANGLLAINTQKQHKLFLSAELFLAKHPQLINFPCRFDVALVSYQQKLAQKNQFIFTLKEYIQAAFDFC